MKKRVLLILTAGATLLLAQKGGPKTFATPEEARDALIQAAASGHRRTADVIDGTLGIGLDEETIPGDPFV